MTNIPPSSPEGLLSGLVPLKRLLLAVVPLVFRRIGVDPAVASGPLITTLNDGLSLLLYFGVAFPDVRTNKIKKSG